MRRNSYRKLFWMSVISFLIMYGVMFLNVDKSADIYLSRTRFYLSLLMVAPMVILMLTMMHRMYPNKRWNKIIRISAAAVFALALLLLRTQTFIGDRQYMKAMIPHHSSAIMTSRHADIKDPELKQLSEQIIRSQEAEIEVMKKLLSEQH
jgi:hypothetical protein